MARYGRVFRGRRRGLGYGGDRGSGYTGYGEYTGYGDRGRYAGYGGDRDWREWRPRRPFRRGYGYPGEYAGEPGRAEHGVEYGGRGWPYEYDEYERPAGWTRRPGRFEGARWRPGGYGYGRRRLRRRRPREMPWEGHPRYGAEFEGGVGYGYGRGYGRRGRIGRYAGRAYVRRHEPRYGFTPSSRWPEDGHDLDHLGMRERAMGADEIRDAVMENLFQDGFVDPRDVHVEVEDGVVTLSGDVNDYLEARYVWDDAWESPGVHGVINNLTVRTDRPSDEMDLPQTSGRMKSVRPTRGGSGEREGA